MTDGGSTEAQQAALKQCAEAKQSKLLDDPGFRTPNVTLDPISNLHSIGLHTTNIRASNGGLYTVNTEKPCYKLFREGGVDGRGRLSPTVKVTLGDEAKKALGIPASAMHFAFAYPLAFPAEAGEQIDAVLDEISAAISDPRVPNQNTNPTNPHPNPHPNPSPNQPPSCFNPSPSPTPRPRRDPDPKRRSRCWCSAVSSTGTPTGAAAG